MNYDASKIGLPYSRTHYIAIRYDIDGTAAVRCEQSLAVTLADGSTGVLSQLEPIEFTVDPKSEQPYSIPNPVTGEPLGLDATPQSVFLGILAIIRNQQLKG